MPEVPAPFPDHKIQGCIKASRSVQCSDRLLQNEVGPRLKSILRSRLPIDHRKGHRFGIALSMAEGFQQIEAVVQVVTVNDHGIKFTTRQQLSAALQLR